MPTMASMGIPDRFRAARKRAGFTQVGLANAVSCDPSTVSRIERGDVHPSGEISANIARVCRCDVNELLEIDVDSQSADSTPPSAA
jgi:DNA-binding XRE family transcriptional regulator